MEFSSIKNERLSDKVVRIIIEKIKSGELGPGDKLPPEQELAESLGISRGILREALTVLQARNYILRKPREGTIINDTSGLVLDGFMGMSLEKASYLDLLELRECIEQRSVEKVIDFATEEEVEELKSLAVFSDRSKRKKTPDYYFHYRLAQLSRNIMFINLIDMYYDVIDALTSHTIKEENRREEITKEHLLIVAAVEKRDKKAARGAVLYHLKKVRENITRSMQ